MWLLMSNLGGIFNILGECVYILKIFLMQLLPFNKYFMIHFYMKKQLQTYLFTALIACFSLLASFQAQATHIFGMDLRYSNVTGLTYRITLTVYGDCAPSGSSSFATSTEGNDRVADTTARPSILSFGSLNTIFKKSKRSLRFSLAVPLSTTVWVKPNG
jgi:hypothetical protein